MSRPRYEALGVDWDGTIQNTLMVWLDACQCHLQARNILLAQTIVAQEITPHLNEAIHHGVADIEAFVQAVMLQASPLLPVANLNTELWTVLQHLKKQGVQQSIISSSSEQSIRQAMQHHHMNPHHFTHIISCDQVTHTKPHPEPVLRACQSMLVNPGQLAILGDSPADILAGQAAGVDTIWFYPPENEPYYDYQTLKQLGPTHIARSANEVAQIVTQTR